MVTVRWGHHHTPHGRICVARPLFNGSNFATLAASAEVCEVPTSSLERRVAQHYTVTHTCLINESSAALTNFLHPCGLMHWASNVRQASALTHERGHASRT